MKSIDKLRTSARNMAKGSNLANHEECNLLLVIADEIEAEIERDYMPKPKIEKNFNAIKNGITDISEALQNIAECNAAKCAMRQEVTHADVETMIGSIAAIADAYYMRLPRDADNEPIHVGDEIQFRNDSPITVDSIGTSRVYESDWGFFGSNGGFYGQGTMKNVHHVKPRTLEDVLREYGHAYYAHMTDNYMNYDGTDDQVIGKYADEIRELLGGDAE